MDVTIHADEAYPASVEFSRRQHRNLSATQLLWAKLERTAARVALVRDTLQSSDPLDLAVLAQCEERLRLARDRIDRAFRQTWSFWELVHRVDEELLLVTPEAMLAAEATDVLAKFRRHIKDPVARQAWLGADETSGVLPGVVRRLTAGASPHGGPPGDGLRQGDRHVLRNALNLVNEQGDTNFWRLASNVSVQTLSAMLLLLLCGGAVLRHVQVPGARVDVFDTLMLGAAGAILATMVATKPMIVSIGATSRYYVHHLLVKPVIGAFAAGLVYLLENAGLVFITTSQAGSGDARAFVRAIVAVAAGFAGEWMLRPMMDKVLRAISAQSEKVTTTTASTQP